MASRRVWLTLFAGVAAPVALAVAWIPLRAAQTNVVVALALVMVITATGAAGRRSVVLAAAVSAALAFVFFDTLPYDRFRISRQADVATAIALVVVGALTGELALRVTRLRRADRAAVGDLGRVQEVSSRLARGEELVPMISAVAGQLTNALEAVDCSYTAEPLPAGVAVVDRAGRVEMVGERVALPVWGLGTVLGHFVVQLHPGQVARREALAVAVTLADQVGAAVAAQAGVPAGQPDPHYGAPALRIFR